MKLNISTLIAILTGMFTGAKLAHAISWSWWIVFSPLIIYWGGYALILIITALIVGICWLIGYGEELNKNASSKHED